MTNYIRLASYRFIFDRFLHEFSRNFTIDRITLAAKLLWEHVSSSTATFQVDLLCFCTRRHDYLAEHATPQ